MANEAKLERKEAKLGRKEEKAGRKAEKITRREILEINQEEKLAKELGALFQKEPMLIREVYPLVNKIRALRSEPPMLSKQYYARITQIGKQLEETVDEGDRLLGEMRKEAKIIFKDAKRAEALLQKEEVEGVMRAHIKQIEKRMGWRRTVDARDFKAVGELKNAIKQDSKIVKIEALVLHLINMIMGLNSSSYKSYWRVTGHEEEVMYKSAGTYKPVAVREEEEASLLNSLSHSYETLTEQIKLLNQLFRYLIVEERMDRYMFNVERKIDEEIRSAA